MNAPVATPPRSVRLNAADNVVVAVDPIEPGSVIYGATAKVRVPRGHKMAVMAIADGAGGSRMFSVRGPQMVANHYEPATMKVETWQKDMKIIAEFAAEVGAPTPLFHATAPIYSTAMAQGRGTQDTAAVFAVLADMARLELPTPKASV